MGQNCCSELPEAEYLKKMNQSTLKGRPNNSLILQATAQQEDVPNLLENTYVPSFNRSVKETYDQLGPYEIKEKYRVQGTPAGPKLIPMSNIIYDGEWKNCRPHGKGIMYWPDGSMYEGAFNDGTPDLEGRLINNNGVYYEGSISKGEAYGFGVLDNKLSQYYY
jgi:hypothetical protein